MASYQKGGSAFIPGLKTGVFLLRPLHPLQDKPLPGEPIPFFTGNACLPEDTHEQVDADLWPMWIWDGQNEIPFYHEWVSASPARPLESQGLEILHRLVP